jgi:hypothetical protein
MNSISTTLRPSRLIDGIGESMHAIASAGMALLRRTPPAESQRLRNAVQEAADVRALAQSFVRSDPSFAADLFAAADRHESLFGDLADATASSAPSASGKVRR